MISSMKIRLSIRTMLILLLCLLLPLLVLAEDAASGTAGAQLTLSAGELQIARGKNAKLTAAYDTEAYGKKLKLTWDTSDKTVATVANGTVTGKGAGTAEITCHVEFPDGTAADAVCKVSVYQPVTSMTAKPLAMTVPAGKTVSVAYEIKPADATYQAVTWTSSDPEIATVDESGAVTGVNLGKATVVGELNEPGVDKQKSVKITVTVTRGVESIHIAPFLKVAKGKSEKVTCNITPEDATDKKINWTSSDPKVAAVSNGTIRGVGTGTCTITAEAADGSGATSSCQVVVVQAVTGVKSSSSRYVVFEESTVRLGISVLPADATDKTVTYRSENPSVATVNENGVVTGKKAGNCTIIVTAADGSEKTARCNVVVEPKVCMETKSFTRRGYFGFYDEYGISFRNLTKTKTINYFKYNLVYKYRGTDYKITGNWCNDTRIMPNSTSKVLWWENLSMAEVMYSNNWRIYLTYVSFTDGTSVSLGSDGVLIAWYN